MKSASQQETLTVEFTVSVEMNQKESLLWTESGFGGYGQAS
jgi:hypothetical protein